jgi:hypothetical protein
MCSRHARLPWKDRARRDAVHGIGLVDTLVALLLLALSLLGACTVIVRTMGASHAAAIQTIAVDLGTDLGEDLRAGAIDSLEIRNMQIWRHRVAGALPVGVPPLDAYADVVPMPPQAGEPRGFNVTLRWWDPAIHRPTTLALQIADALMEPES